MKTIAWLTWILVVGGFLLVKSSEQFRTIGTLLWASGVFLQLILAVAFLVRRDRGQPVPV